MDSFNFNVISIIVNLTYWRTANVDHLKVQYLRCDRQRVRP